MNKKFKHPSLRVIPKHRETKQSLVLFRHCESRPFVDDYIKKQMNFLITENFVFSKLKFILTKGRGEAIPKMNFSAEGGSSFGGEFLILNFE